jgi:hypothetical protein
MILNYRTPWRRHVCRYGLALILAGSASTAKAQCAEGGGGTTTTTTSAALTGGAAAAGMTGVNISSFRPVTAQSSGIMYVPAYAMAAQNQASLQMRSAINQRILAQKLAVMRKEAVAKKAARDAAVASGLPAKKTARVRTTEMTDSQREASQRYWTTLASLPSTTVD